MYIIYLYRIIIKNIIVLQKRLRDYNEKTTIFINTIFRSLCIKIYIYI